MSAKLSIVLAAAVLATLPLPAHARHWTEVQAPIDSGPRYHGVVARDLPAFQSALRAAQQFLPVYGDVHIGTHMRAGLSSSGAWARLEGVTGLAANLAWFQSGWQHLAITGEPRVDRQPDGTFIASGTIWRHLPVVGWALVTSLPPSPAVGVDKTETFVITNQNVGFDHYIPGVTWVRLNAWVYATIKGRSDFQASVNGIDAHVRVDPEIIMSISGHSGVTGSVFGTFSPEGSYTNIETRARVGFLENDAGSNWRACADWGVKLEIVDALFAYLRSSVPGVPFFITPGMDYLDQRWLYKQCMPLW